MSSHTLDHLDVFFGDASSAEARVYARLPSAGLPVDCRLAGRVVGPTCEYSRTLPATVPFMKQSGRRQTEQPLLVEAVLPDPCFWSQDLPFLYRAQVELRRGSDVLASVERRFGIRPLGARGRALVWESRPWVARAADARELPERPLAEWRAADLAMLVEDPNEQLCDEATRLGVVLIAAVTVAKGGFADELRRLARWPAVAIAILDAGVELDESSRSAACNLLLAERRDIKGVEPVGRWADLVVCESASTAEIMHLTEGLTTPVLARCPAGWCDDLAEARRRCDLLQRELAGRGDFSGYFV